MVSPSPDPVWNWTKDLGVRTHAAAGIRHIVDGSVLMTGTIWLLRPGTSPTNYPQVKESLLVGHSPYLLVLYG